MPRCVTILVMLKPRVVVLGIAFLLVVGALVWFWLLASVPREEAAMVTLHVPQGSVQVKRAAEGAFTDASEGMVLQTGDAVKTAEGARAVVRFFGVAESQLEGNTELVIADAAQQADTPDSLQVKLQLVSGRVWSRVLRLFDVHSRFDVQTPAVVATVRGTAFDVGYGADQVTRIWVADSAVSVMSEALPAGEMARYDAQGKTLERRALSVEDRDTAWFKENRQRDQAFVAEVVQERRLAFARLGGTRPDRLLAGVTGWSERLHLFLARGAARERKQEAYLVRRLAHLVALAEAGKSGLATQEFARLEQEIRQGLRNDPEGALRSRARVAFIQVSRLLEAVDTRSPLYPLKQRLEDALLMLQEEDRAAAFFTRLVAVDARLDEAVRLIDEEAFDDAVVLLDGARGGIENVGRDVASGASLLPPVAQEAIGGMLLALSAREAAERARLEVARTRVDEPEPSLDMPVEVATSTSPIVPTSTVPTIPTVPVVPVIPTSTPPVVIPRVTLQSLSLMPATTSVKSGQRVTLAAVATYSDGRTADVTQNVTWSFAPAANGSLSGNVFVGTNTATSTRVAAPVTVTVSGFYTEGGTTVQGTSSIIVN